MTKDRGMPPLLLDVDGCLNCLHVGVDALLQRGFVSHDALGPNGRSYLLHLDPHLRDRLSRLRAVFEIVWCTTWRNANETISPLVSLPNDLDQVWLPTAWTDVAPGLCPKTAFVRQWAQDRGVDRLAWIDDEATEADQLALMRASSPPDPSELNPEREQRPEALPLVIDALVVTADPSQGLTDQHVEILLAWA